MASVAYSNVQKLRTSVSLFENLTAAQIAAYQALSYATDLSPALEEIIADLDAGPGGDVFLPPGGPLLDNVNVPDDSKIRIFGAGAATVIKKGANGPVFTLGKQCVVENLSIDGDGASRTGQGVYVSSGALDNFSWRRMRGVDVFNTASYCIEFSGNRAGYASHIIGCRLVPKDLATYAIKMAGNGGVTESNGNRMLRDVWTFGNRIADLTDANNTDMIGCHGFWPKFTATTDKTSISGGRINLYDALDVLTGTANTVGGITLNASGGAVLTIEAGATNCRFDNSVAVGSGLTIVDNSVGGANGTAVWLPSVVFTPAWGFTAGTQPTIGNGSLGGRVERRGERAHINMLLTIGSTTALNSSTQWTFSLPYTATRTAVGQCRILDAGTSYRDCWVEVTGNLARVYFEGAGVPVGYNTPITWAVGDTLTFDVDIQL